MERVIERLRIARQALATLQELVVKPSLLAIERDATIQRFEYTFEAVWKSAQTFLIEIEGIIVNSPKSAVRSSWQTGYLDEETARLALQMCEARNLTGHTDNEQLSISLAGQIKQYSQVLQTWLEAMEKKINEAKP